jgi:MbtH protein
VSVTDVREWAAVINSEGQFSVWAADTSPPPGWWPTGIAGSRTDCLAQIARWSELGPLDVRRPSRAG